MESGVCVCVRVCIHVRVCVSLQMCVCVLYACFSAGVRACVYVCFSLDACVCVCVTLAKQHEHSCILSQCCGLQKGVSGEPGPLRTLWVHPSGVLMWVHPPPHDPGPSRGSGPEMAAHCGQDEVN